MRFLYKNLAPIYVALVAGLMPWLLGGSMLGPLVKTVPWLMLFMTEVMFVFPQAHENETSYDARERVWGRMKKDPLVWTALGFLVLLVVPFVNNGLCANCDAQLIAQGVSADPPVKFLPFCVSRPDHLDVFLWFVTALSCLIATKHCLTKKGKRLLLSLIVWNGAALAVVGFVQIVSKAPGPLWQKLPDGLGGVHFFSAWGYENMAGDYFTTAFGLAVALWRWRFDEERERVKEISSQTRAKPRDLFWKQNLYLVPAALCYIAALNTMSRSAILLATGAAILFFVHAFRSFTARMPRAKRVRMTAVVSLVVGIVAFVALTDSPEPLKKEVKTLDTREVLDRVTGKNEKHVTIAKELWKDHKLFGCGGWGYRHFYFDKVGDTEVETMRKYQWARTGKANVHNDYMQFLAEHGLVGFGLLVALVFMLLRPVCLVWKTLVTTARFQDPKERPPRPLHVFALPAPAFCILTACCATVIHGVADCPFRTASILTLFFVSLAAIDGFMPKISEQGADRSKEHGRHHHHHHH